MIVNVPTGTFRNTTGNGVLCPEPVTKTCVCGEEFMTFYDAETCPDCVDIIEDEDDPVYDD